MAVKKTRVRKVWYIARFKERYEYRDDKHKQGSLEYTKSFVNANRDPESRHFIDQIEELKEKETWLRLEGIFNELMRRAADDTYQYRGYLLHQHKPADAARIAVWLRCDVKICQRDLADLESVGLIEQVPLPDFPENTCHFFKNSENPAGEPEKYMLHAIFENPEICPK